MRKHVKPADPLASIPDPTRGGNLSAEGLTVDWSVHWARLAQRGDIIVTDVKTETTAAVEPALDPTVGSVASVPFMITTAMRKRLRALGKTDDEIAQMKPEEAQALLATAGAPSA